MSEEVKLLLKKHKFKVNKNKLAERSKYFSALFTNNFKDSFKNSYKIKFDVSEAVLQVFLRLLVNNKKDENVDFANDPETYIINKTLRSVCKSNPKHIIHLLRLCVYFGVDGLIEDIKQTINVYQPVNEIILIWDTVRNLCLNTMKEICFYICLERFEALPVKQVILLPKDDFTSLINNVNVACSLDHLRYVVRLWEDHNNGEKVHFLRSRRGEPGPKLLTCVPISANNAEDWSIYSWNHRCLTELLDNLKRVYSGMQIIGRRFSIYVVGGEKGMGSGRFNNVIWRYCLVTKKWYNMARLPRLRRHMVAKFINNKLILAGGVGCYRIKLSSVDILDIDTGEWHIGQDVPEEFTDIPPNCVVGNNLYFYKTGLHQYNIDTNSWTSTLFKQPDSVHPRLRICTEISMSLASFNNYLFLCGLNSVYEPTAVKILNYPNLDLSDIYNSLTQRRRRARCIPEVALKQFFLRNIILNENDPESEVRWTWPDPLVPVYNKKYAAPVFINPIYFRELLDRKAETKIGPFSVIDPETLHEQY